MKATNIIVAGFTAEEIAAHRKGNQLNSSLAEKIEARRIETSYRERRKLQMEKEIDERYEHIATRLRKEIVEEVHIL